VNDGGRRRCFSFLPDNPAQIYNAEMDDPVELKVDLEKAAN
jgi:hypothetical protein